MCDSCVRYSISYANDVGPVPMLQMDASFHHPISFLPECGTLPSLAHDKSPSGRPLMNNEELPLAMAEGDVHESSYLESPCSTVSMASDGDGYRYRVGHRSGFNDDPQGLRSHTARPYHGSSTILNALFCLSPL